MAQAPRHIRLDDVERLLPPSLVSLGVRMRDAKRRTAIPFPIRLSLLQAEQIITDYKDLRERLGVCRDELAYAKGQGLKPPYGHTFVRRKKPSKAVSSVTSQQVSSKWSKVLEGLQKGDNR